MFFIFFKMLQYDKAKYFGLIFAIAVATFLMAQQISIFIAAMNRTGSQIMDIREANLWVMDPKTDHFEEFKPMRDIDLYRIKGIEGVEWAVPMFKGFALINTKGNVIHQAWVFGVDNVSLIGKLKMLAGHWNDLKDPNSIILDKAGWKIIFGNEPYQIGRVIQINDQRKVIVGIADPSPPFFAFPLVYTTFQQAVELVPTGRLRLSFILVGTKTGYSPEGVAQRILKETGLFALTPSQFKWRSIDYVIYHTPIPANFALTVSLGFLIGTVVVGLTFYIFILENLSQFALLKVLGVTNQQLLKMMMLQAGWIAFIGFSIGIGLCVLFSEITSRTILDLQGVYVPWQVILIVGISILIIILLACIAGIRKILILDPAIVFKG